MPAHQNFCRCAPNRRSVFCLATRFCARSRRFATQVGLTASEALRPWRTLSFILLLGIAELAVTGCRSRTGGSGGGPEPGVVAQVNGYKVLRAELDRGYSTQTAGAPQKFISIEEEAVRLQILDQIIQTRLILEKAEQLGIKASDSDVEARLTEEKTPYTVEQFQKKLKELGLTEDDYKTYTNHALTVEKVMAKEITPRLNIPEADINAYYDQNKGRLTQPVDEAQVKRQIGDKMRSELEQILKAAYVEQLRNHAEIRNYYAEEVLKNHKPESK
jgi:SurA-like N-terminal domain